jgi:20S proteasome alpha/beta subunit
MTTLAYSRKENVIAVDSRCTSGGIAISNKSNKWITKGKNVYFFCGDVADVERLVDLIEDGIEQLEEGEHLDATVILALPDPMTFYVDDSIIKTYKLHYDDYTAYGTGAPWALSAFDHGATAKKAVEYAMTRDIYTGGKVVQYDLTKQGFKK